MADSSADAAADPEVLDSDELGDLLAGSDEDLKTSEDEKDPNSGRRPEEFVSQGGLGRRSRDSLHPMDMTRMMVKSRRTRTPSLTRGA